MAGGDGTIVVLIGLFAAAFTSATLLPGSSEVALAGILAGGLADPFVAVLVATVGNTAGSCVNWAIGRYLARFRDHPRFPVSRDRFEKTVHSYQRFGIWSLLLSWAPVIGDPLTVIAGFLRTPFLLFVLLVAVAKAGRYIAVAGLASLF